MKRFNFERFTRLKEKARSKWRAVCFWKRNRYGKSFSDELRNKIAEEAGIGVDETLLMMLDDSTFRTRDKNVVLTDRRILWQNIKGGKYESIELESLKGASVFADRARGKTVLCLVRADAEQNEAATRTINAFAPVIAQIWLKHFAMPDVLRTIFHDYLSKYCSCYMPFDTNNYQYYKKTVSPLLHTAPAAATVLSAVGIVSLGMLALWDVVFTVRERTDAITQATVYALLMLTLLAWTVNLLLPNTKSKMSKLLLLWAFAVGYCLLDYYRYLPEIHKELGFTFPALPNQLLLAIKAVFAVLWLLFDKVDFDKLTRIALSLLGGLSILLALMGLAAGIRVSCMLPHIR